MQLRQQALQTKIADLYDLYREQPSIIHASAQYLFTQTKESLASKTRQYLLCWIRSVEVAIKHQESETDLLRQQPARFFGNQPTTAVTLETGPVTTSSRITELQTPDITTPEKYNLRRPRQHIRDLLSDTDSEDTAIPPAMFDDVMDSSYEFSAQRDVNLRGYQPISPTELADLGASSIQLSSSTSSIDDSYQCSHQSDIFLPKGYISCRPFRRQRLASSQWKSDLLQSHAFSPRQRHRYHPAKSRCGSNGCSLYGR
jgi:hypothetical protein